MSDTLKKRYDQTSTKSKEKQREARTQQRFMNKYNQNLLSARVISLRTQTECENMVMNMNGIFQNFYICSYGQIEREDNHERGRRKIGD